MNMDVSNEANAPTETLTDDMIRALRDEAAAAGDLEMVAICDAALGFDDPRSRSGCARAITSARAMDDSRPFVRVVP